MVMRMSKNNEVIRQPKHNSLLQLGLGIKKTVFHTYHNRLSIEFDGLVLTAIISQLSYVRDRQSKPIVLRVQNLEIDSYLKYQTEN